MTGIHIKFYLHENRKHKGKLLYEWMLERAKEIGIHGGSVFRAIAGYGRHGLLHEEHFFELGSNLPLEVTFNLDENELNQLLTIIKNEKLDIFYVKMPVDFGLV